MSSFREFKYIWVAKKKYLNELNVVSRLLCFLMLELLNHSMNDVLNTV